MKAVFCLSLLLALLVSCAPTRSRAWRVEELEIALYHSSTIDPDSGAMAHIEYCAARLTRGDEVIHLVYRPIDWPDRLPGFAVGDAVAVDGLEQAKDYGAVEGKDYWLGDVRVIPLICL